jgi:hypothetical protein
MEPKGKWCREKEETIVRISREEFRSCKGQSLIIARHMDPEWRCDLSKLKLGVGNQFW